MFIHSQHHMNLAYDGSSAASSSLVSGIGSASFSCPQLLKELMHGFNCDDLKKAGKEQIGLEVKWKTARKTAKLHISHVKQKHIARWVIM